MIPLSQIPDDTILLEVGAVTTECTAKELKAMNPDDIKGDIYKSTPFHLELSAETLMRFIGKSHPDMTEGKTIELFKEHRAEFRHLYPFVAELRRLYGQYIENYDYDPDSQIDILK